MATSAEPNFETSLVHLLMLRETDVDDTRILQRLLDRVVPLYGRNRVLREVGRYAREESLSHEGATLVRRYIKRWIEGRDRDIRPATLEPADLEFFLTSRLVTAPRVAA